MAIVFPTSPSDGDTITVDNRSYVYSSSDGAWKHSGGSAGTELSNDSSPQLGGDLDLNSNAITGTGNITTTGTLSLTNTSTDDSLLITTTEDTSTAGPVITLKRNSSSPANADYLGQIKFKGENDADQEVVYSKITSKILDAGDGSEDGAIEFSFKKGGSNNISGRFRSDSLQLINGTSLVVYNITYPTADGTAGQVIKTDGSGTLSFTDALTSSAPANIYSASSDPTSNLTAGQIYYNTSDKYFKYYNGTNWSSLNDPSISVDTVDPFGDSSSVALWQLNGNANDAGGNYNLSGDTSSGNFTTGKFGSAFSGSGTNHLISTASGLNVSGDYSCSFWYKSNTTGQSNKRVLTIKGQNRTTGFNNYNNSLGFYHGSGETNVGTAGSVTRVAEIPDASINDNNWHHIAFSITSSGTYAWYLDGSSYSGTVSGEGRSFNSGSYFAITTYDAGDSYNSICLVDQVRLFNRVITASEVSDLYNTST